MKREFLKGLDVSDENIDKIMSENGKDIEKYKTLSDTQKTELDTTITQLVEANKQIDSYKSMDIETIKKNADEYKTKFEQSEQDKVAQIEALKYETALDKYIGTLKIKDDVHATNLKNQIMEKKLQFEEDKLIGGDDIVKGYKEKYPTVFEEETPPPQFAGSTQNKNPGIITGDPDKMDYNTYKAWRKQN